MERNAAIRFGTSGWRAIIAEDYTFDNVRLATQGIADYWKAELRRKSSPIFGRRPRVVIGHDTRFMGPQFSEAAAQVLAHNGLEPLLCDRDAPTPVIAHTIRAKKLIGGVNVTASHNPAEYQGLKFSIHNGAAAPPDATKKVERLIAKRHEAHWRFRGSDTPPPVRRIDPRPSYLKRLRQLVDLDAIRKANLKTAVELMYGTGRDYLDALLEEGGARVVRFHDYLNPSFGGGHPEPNAAGMAEAREAVLKRRAQIGLGLDGDADRFGVVDRDGAWLTPNQILPLTLYHLKKNRGWTGDVVRTVPTSHQVDAVAESLGVRVHETPVGFKYIGALMESRPIIVGGEESGGLSVKGHVPEKDGILACLLMAELVAVEGKPLGRILRDLEKISGPFFTDRVNVKVPESEKAVILERLAAGVDKVGVARVERHITTDGHKFLLPGGEWVAFRASGTEPVFRCYVEAKSEASLRKLRRAAAALLTAK